MKGLKWAQTAGAAAALLAASVLLAGCKGFWDAPPGGGGGGTASGVFYVMNSGQSQVAGFAFASGSTTPAAVTNGSTTFQHLPLAMAMAPGGGFLYISSGDGIFAFSISSGGALTLLNSNVAIAPGEAATAMAMDGSGTWLLESVSGSGVLNAIPIDGTTGVVDTTRNSGTAYTATLPSPSLSQIAVSPTNSTSPYVFVAMGTGGTAVIPFNAGSTGTPFGSVANIAVKHTSGSSAAIAVDPQNRLLYVGETAAVSGTQTGGLRVFTIGSSAINEITGSPYKTAGIAPSAILPTPDGNFVYVANKTVSGSSSGNISGFPINSSAGVYSLGTIINTIAAGTSTVGLAEESTHTYLLAINSSNSNSSPDLSVYTFDTTTSGKLNASTTAATGTDPAVATQIVAVP